jgi:hypothetical protein
MKYAVVAICCSLLSSCSDSFINHDLEYKKIGNCTNEIQPIQVLSNTNGERYHFFCCLNDGFDGKNYTVTRSGDSILVEFPQKEQRQVLYELTLDIDAKPAYHHIILDGRDVTIVPRQM